MHRNLRITISIFLAATLLGACSKIPDHARYIPKDAVAVAGINLKGLSKKIAWNMITGSKLFKEMQDRIPEKSTKDAMNGIEKAGIDLLNTLYVYVKPDTRFKGGNIITGLVPLSDASEWEGYVKRVFPQAEIKQHGDHKEASLGRDMFVGWNDHLLVIINVMSVPTDYSQMDRSTAGPMDKPMEDLAGLSAEMDNAFAIAKDNSIVDNPHFAGLQAEGHDVTFWLNYGQLMDQYGTGGIAGTGVSLSGALWKDAAFTSGFDFVKGKITGDMRYYLPDEMKEIGNEIGGTNINKDMLDRLPNQNLDMLFAMHISTNGIKLMLEKMGLLGIANAALQQQNMSMDNVLNSFTGDMSFVMNDFSLHTETEVDSFMGQAVVHQNQKPELSMSYAMKINSKQDFQKLVDLAKQNHVIQSGNGFIVPLSEKDTVYAMMNDQYLVISNKYPYANGFLQGDFKNQKSSAPKAMDASTHPFALYMDVQQLFKNIDPSITHSPQDSIMIMESKNLLSNISLDGGEFKNNAFSAHLDINFVNTDENSLIELMDYGMKINDAAKTGQH